MLQFATMKRLLLPFVLLTLVSAGQNCPTRDLAFELITGYVYTSPDFILDTLPGVLLLEECLLHCHRNASCKAINYETGLCVLFSSNVDDDGGKS